METHASAVNRSSAVLRQNFGNLWAAAAWPHIGVALCYIAVGVVIHAHITSDTPDPVTQWQTMSDWAKLGVTLIFVITAALPYGLAVAGVSAMTWKHFERGSASLGDAFTAIGHRVVRLIVLSLGLAGFVLVTWWLIIPPILVALFCAFAVPVLIIERTGAWKAVRRSFALTKGRMGPIVGLKLAQFLIAVFGMIALLVAIKATPADLPWWAFFVSLWILLSVFASLVQLVEGVFVTQLYITSRVPVGEHPQVDVSAS